jgi:hypothetical protein
MKEKENLINLLESLDKIMGLFHNKIVVVDAPMLLLSKDNRKNYLLCNYEPEYGLHLLNNLHDYENYNKSEEDRYDLFELFKKVLLQDKVYLSDEDWEKVELFALAFDRIKFKVATISKYSITKFTFDGKTLVIYDENNNAIKLTLVEFPNSTQFVKLEKEYSKSKKDVQNKGI